MFRLMFLALGLAVTGACAREAPLTKPRRVALNAPATLIAEQCGIDSDFVTDPALVAPPTEIAPDVIVAIYPRRESRNNTARDLNGGNLIARYVNTGTADYWPWALSAGGTSCLVFALRGGQRPEGRFVSLDEARDVPAPRPSYRYHANDHGRDSAAFRKAVLNSPAQLPPPARVSQAPDASLFRFAAIRRAPLALAQGGSGFDGGIAWSTCMLNGCCEVGY